MVEIVKEAQKEEKKLEKFFKNKSNIWMIVSVVLAVILVAMLVWPNGLSGTKAGEKIVALANAQGADATLVSVKSVSGLYLVTVSIDAQKIPVYVTKDGKLFTTNMVTLSETDSNSQTNTPAEVPKTDKPQVELYIWGYCPYGIAAQGPLASVAELLKLSANFEIVPYYDGHGAFETQQNKIQLCIQKNAKSLYWKYAAKFVSDVYPKCSVNRDISCDKDESIKAMNAVGINSVDIMKCVESEGATLFEAASVKAQTNGVTGSPTLMINGVAVNAERNSEAYKTSVCDAFNTAPSACSTTLNSDATTASGNC